ncbi:RecQ family ATP-dependent DNA helicase [Vibrio sp. ZSDE26]|uniref:ATP-dependent DNA helicase RecQ n=1 Tax=Vibrio amylolyticus TaxID=2847292 RepID=A0A9X2BH41_9VIBR|nr:RecQ family ATP-dependent DNA helicase [Vibrio amylolyticus]MCK6262565.1 RecQ family ATP-dependent DNA helicase [Vibrio amylolyticus]
MIEQTLKQTFGFDSLRGGQQQVIDTVMSGHSCAAIFPTGAGKSLCYQLPALHLPHLTLVISPLLALMKDQLSFLHDKGIAAASIDSSQDRQQTQQVMADARSGQLKILMISVERLKNERFRQFISQVPISLLVVDEAHCISEWGHNFRPDYLKIPHYQQTLNIPQTLLLTATATSDVISDMQNKFAISSDNTVVTGFYRNNLDLSIIPSEQQDKLNQLNQTIQASPLSPTIVYVTLQHTAEYLAEQLQQTGISALAYHAGLESQNREYIQQQFMTGEINCIVATIAFGMGVDKSDIRRVIHFDLPKSIENYAQEIGRAGRDGQHSQCILLGNKDGLNTLNNFVYGDTPDRESIEYVVKEIYQHSPMWEVQLIRFSKDSNIRQLPLKTLLVYLELEGVITPKYSYFSDYRFKFITQKQQIIDKFEGERRLFVESIFTCSPQARTWCQIDFDALWQGFHAERQRVVKAIDYFNEQGWIELESKQITDVYQVTDITRSQSEVIDKLDLLFKNKEKAETVRLTEMIGFFESDTCLSHRLAHYFSDHNAPQACGHCSACRGIIASLPQQVNPPIDLSQLIPWIEEFENAGSKSLTHEALTRMLCGITTPLSTKLKAKKMGGFARLEQYPFSEVLKMVQEVRKS